ncbi:MAG: SDR family NAD(P)-dependent oxidoreductase [Myxococcota bacterium]
MAEALVFISGASSGIGAALARNLPFASGRLFDVSRRGGDVGEHFAADLADPTDWPRVAALFDREMKGFEGERVVFVHAAGTLQPMGFAGEVDPEGYARQVLLNAASFQVLGDAFLRAARETRAPCTLLNIGSGAAHSVYEGWSAYCAGKAAADHWVRTVGAEQKRHGGRCRVLSIAPGVVATAMQEQIREMSPEEFPEVERFRDLYREGALRDPDEVARELWELLDVDLENGAVLDLRDA